MRIVPDSTITLYGGVDIDNGEQLVFKSRANQTAYFQSKLVRAQTPCTVVRKTGRLRVEIAGSVIATCNYLSFINPSFDNKIVYARIVDYDYINNECVEISYIIDYWQTWMFDVTFENMYIEREHLSQADFAKAETNPYDPTIFEFKTAESLPIARDLEKKMYTVGADDTTDGMQIANAVESVINVDGTVGILIKLAEIDFEDLDSVDPDTSKPFAQYLEKIGNDNLGFYRLTDTMGTYLGTKYPGGSGVPHVYNNTKAGPTWENANLVPCKYTSKFNPSCTLIYDPNGGNELNGNGHMSELLTILTQLKAEGQIISMHMIPNNLFAFSCEQAAGGVIKVGQKTAKTTLPIQVTNRKLMRYPFSYIREIAPNGDMKELHYEDFKEVMDGTQDYGRINCVLDVGDQPTLIIAPYKYQYTGMSDDVTHDDANILESLIFAQFPSAPYNIDSYLAAVAASAVNTIAGRTVDGAYELAQRDIATDNTSRLISNVNGFLGAITGGAAKTGNPQMVSDAGTIGLGSVASTAGAALKGIAGGFSSAGSLYGTNANFEIERGKFENAAAMWNEADSALAGDNANAISANLRLAKPAYACNQYIMSNGNGVINFSQLSFCDITVLRVHLNSDILAIYDNWFNMYGYTSGRCGIPRVINYMHGDTAQADIPAWATVNNKPTTYIKTMDCKVIHSMIPVASFIKNMFDSGVRMIQGDAE